MSLKDIVDRISDEAEKLFHHDADADRRETLATAEKNKAAFGDPSKRRFKGRWFEHGNNNQVSFEPTRPDGQPIIIGGKPVTFWSVDEFPGVLDSFIAAVRAGELDDQLEGATPAGTSLPEKKLKQPRKPRSDAGTGWSPERRAKFQQTVAARKAAKG